MPRVWTAIHPSRCLVLLSVRGMRRSTPSRASERYRRRCGKSPPPPSIPTARNSPLPLLPVPLFPALRTDADEQWHAARSRLGPARPAAQPSERQDCRAGSRSGAQQRRRPRCLRRRRLVRSSQPAVMAPEQRAESRRLEQTCGCPTIFNYTVCCCVLCCVCSLRLLQAPPVYLPALPRAKRLCQTFLRLNLRARSTDESEQRRLQ